MIRFDIHFGQNEVADCEAACFGWLSSTSDEWYKRSKIQTNANKRLADDFIAGKVAKELVWYPWFTLKNQPGVFDEAWGIASQVVEAFPWLGGAVLMRKATKTVHIQLGDKPCDQTILCIGIVRNYFTVPSFRESFKKARELGASIQEAHIFSALIEYSSDWRGDWSVCTRTLWEYDAVNSATFGRQALRAMLGPNYNPWEQKPWTEQAGYHREEGMIGEFFQGLYDTDPKKLLDTFSIQNDEPILLNQTRVFERTNAGVQNILNQIRQAIQA